MCTYMCIHVFTYVDMYTCTYTYIYIYIYMYLSLSLLVDARVHPSVGVARLVPTQALLFLDAEQLEAWRHLPTKRQSERECESWS